MYFFLGLVFIEAYDSLLHTLSDNPSCKTKICLALTEHRAFTDYITNKNTRKFARSVSENCVNIRALSTPTCVNVLGINIREIMLS